MSLIIDCHTHIFPKPMREARESLCRREEGFARIYGNPKAKMVGVEELLASMEDSGVDRSVVTGFCWSDPELCGLHNDYLLESASRHPDRLIVFLSLPLSDPERSRRELERGIEQGAKGVGEVAFYDREMSRKDLEPAKETFELMQRHGLPLLLHANEPIGHPYPGKGVTPLRSFYDLILSLPDLPIILAHWGGGLLFYELMPEVARAMTQVCYDTAASPFLYSRKIYSVASQVVGSRKILFGSDFPLISPQRYFEEIREADLTSEDRANILGLNLSRLLRLPTISL